MYQELFIPVGLMVQTRITQGIPRKQAIQEAYDVLTKEPNIKKMIDQSDGATRQFVTIAPGAGADWAESGFASVELTHKLAASLMCTSISSSVADNLKLPWKTFGIAIPDGLLGDKHAPSFLLIHKTDKGTVVCIELGSTWFSYGAESSLGGFCNRTIVPTLANPDQPLPLTFGSGDRIAFMMNESYQGKLTTLLGRLIVGVCVELEAPRMQKEVSAKPPTLKVKRGKPKKWTIKLTRPVKLDVRDAVRSYVQGTSGGGPLTVQSLVCGHHKWQPHGPKSSLRKWIHIEPYWKGDEHAPIAVRSHQLG